MLGTQLHLFPMAVFWSLFFIVVCLDQACASSFEQLTDHLLFKNKYNKHVPPAEAADTNITVFVKITPTYLDYDEERSLLTTDAFVHAKWEDPRLKWDPKMFGGLKEINFDSGTIWQPEFYLYNSHSSSMNPHATTRTVVRPSGTVDWFPVSTLTTLCRQEDQHLYPSNVQQCVISLGSWSEHGLQINIQILDEGLDLNHFVNSDPQWEVLQEKVNVSTKENYHDCCVEPYFTLDTNIYLQRRYPSHLKVAWIPCVLVTILTLSLFWIPLFSGKKIALGGFLFLAMTVIMAYVAVSTKPSAAQFQAVSFAQITMCAVTAAIVLEILVMNLASIGNPYRPPGFVVGILSSAVCKWFLVWSPLQPTESMDQIQLGESETDKAIAPNFKYEWIMVATAVDRILFIIFLVVFLTIH